MSGVSPGAVDALIAREYERWKPDVLRTVSARMGAAGAHLDRTDLDAAYNEAWHQLYGKLAEGEDVDSPKGMLTTIAHRRALNAYRALRPGREADGEVVERIAVEPELDRRLDDRATLRRLAEGLRERLDERQLRAATLCYLHGYSRAEAARALGVSPKRMEKVMDGVSKQVGELIGELREGADCERRRSLIRAYAVGLLEEGGERHRLARDHLDECPACRRQVLLMRGLAGITPPLPVLAGASLAPSPSGAEAGAPGRGAGQARQAGRTALVGASAVCAVVAIAAVALAVSGGDGEEPAPSSSGQSAVAAGPSSPSAPGGDGGAQGGGGREVRGSEPGAEGPPADEHSAAAGSPTGAAPASSGSSAPPEPSPTSEPSPAPPPEPPPAEAEPQPAEAEPQPAERRRRQPARPRRNRRRRRRSATPRSSSNFAEPLPTGELSRRRARR